MVGLGFFMGCLALNPACIIEETAPNSCGPASAKVVEVLDGDTVVFETGEQVRYLLIDAPEVAHSTNEESDCYGDEAAAQNRLLVAGKTVDLEYDVECDDRFNRLLAYVYLDGRMINRTLLERGHGRVLRVAPNGAGHCAEFAAIQQDAADAGVGLWGMCGESPGAVNCD